MIAISALSPSAREKVGEKGVHGPDLTHVASGRGVRQLISQRDRCGNQGCYSQNPVAGVARCGRIPYCHTKPIYRGATVQLTTRPLIQTIKSLQG